MNLPLFEELCKTSDEQLFNKVIDNKLHLLYSLLPLAQTVASQNLEKGSTIDNYQKQRKAKAKQCEFKQA